MPEVPICTHCQKPIDREEEEYVVLNKEQEHREYKWVYAHADCQRKGAGGS